jgi:AraC-type DNA-binding domain-containing proteins
MDSIIGEISLKECKSHIDKLQTIVYKDVIINGLCLRILGIHYMDFGNDWQVRTHKHSFHEFHYVIEGKAFSTVNGIESEIESGGYYLMPPGTYHSHRQKQGTNHLGFALRWEFIKEAGFYSSNMTQDFQRLGDMLNKVVSTPMKDDGSIASAFKYLLLLPDKYCSILEMQLAFCSLIFLIARQYNADSTSVTAEGSSTTETNIINNTVRFIEENFSQEIDVYDISNSVHTSYSHLSRLFKRNTGCTMNQYLNNVRLANSQRLLLCTDKNIAQISRESGFENEHYFNTIFKKTYGKTPGRFRNDRSNLTE